MSAKIFVIGAGAWGTALAQAARLAGNDVVLVGRDPAAIDEINSAHTLKSYLGDIALDPAPHLLRSAPKRWPASR